MGRKRKGGTFRIRYYRFIAFILKSQPQNPGAITPETISGVIGCSVSYAHELEAERIKDSWGRVRGEISGDLLHRKSMTCDRT
jgi:hypothetical protein